MGQKRECDRLLETDELRRLNWSKERDRDRPEWSGVTPNNNKRFITVGPNDNIVTLYSDHSTGRVKLDSLAVTSKSKFENKSALEWVNKNIIKG